MKEGRKEGRQEGRKEGRQEGRKEGRKEKNKEGRKKERKERRKEGRKNERKELNNTEADEREKKVKQIEKVYSIKRTINYITLKLLETHLYDMNRHIDQLTREWRRKIKRSRPQGNRKRDTDDTCKTQHQRL